MAKKTHRKKTGRKYWLDDSRNVNRILHGLIVVNILWFAADFLYTKNAAFNVIGNWVDGGIGFYPIYGFVGAFGLVLAAKLLRRFLIRPEDYYDEGRDDVRGA